VISGVSVSHRQATVDDIEAAAGTSQRTTVEALLAHPSVTEAIVLQTCNRSEAYVVTHDAEVGRGALAPLVAGVPTEVVRDLGHEESLIHLMRVASGLESIVLGEDQIIGQVRQAYEDARAAGGIGAVLDDAVLKALHVGERARSETAINEGVVSLGSAAVRLAARERDLAEATALVVGAGEMGSLAAKALEGRVARVIVANRTVPHAEHVAANVESAAEAVGLDALAEAVAAADVVITATGSDDHVLDAALLREAGTLFVIDIAQPRDVAPDAAALPGVDVRDLDALQQVTDQTRTQRREAATQVEAIIDEEFERLLTQYKRKRADEVIATMYEGADRVKSREVETALSKLEAEGDLTPEQRAIVESLADALVSQLLSAPTKTLRDAAERDDWSTINTALQLFEPGFRPTERLPEGVTPGDLSGLSPDDIPAELRGRMPRAVLDELTADDD
jgi:glutamyl-tRNA reductase